MAANALPLTGTLAALPTDQSTTHYTTPFCAQRMGSTSDYTQVPVPSLYPSGTIVPASIAGGSFSIQISGVQFFTLQEDQFVGGHIQLYDANDVSLGVFEITSNGTGATPSITVNLDDLTTEEVADVGINSAVRFENLHDDDIDHHVTQAEMQVDTSLMAAAYAPALVRVDDTRTDLANDGSINVNSEVPFKLNVHGSQLSTINSAKQSAISADFWVAYMVGAFQGPTTEDGDGDNEWLLGVGTLHEGAARSGTIHYRESLRDAINAGVYELSESTLWQLLAVHESAHLFGMDDYETKAELENAILQGSLDGLVMSYWFLESATQLSDFPSLFMGSGLRKIASTEYPGA